MRFLSVRGVIYFYIFICVVLLLFNLLYIFRSDMVKHRQWKRKRRWKHYLDSRLEGSPMWKQDKVLHKLRDVRELIALHEALEDRSKGDRSEAAAFFREEHQIFLNLAVEYGKKPPMEQAFLAYVIAAFSPAVGDRRDPLLEQLLGYLEDSTVYSRENVLNALCALGNPQAIEHAFILLSQRDWYHDPRLLSDGLNRFQGDKEALAQRLWARRGQFLTCFQVGTVRFAETLPGDNFAGPFLQALETEPLPLDTKFTLVRYFHHHAIPRAKPLLLRLLKGEDKEERELAIAAAVSLSSYPGEETRQALKDAIHSSSWYIRQNAAHSLKVLGITQEDVEEMAASGDRYAAEMLEYVMGNRAVSDTAEGERKESEVLAAV